MEERLEHNMHFLVNVNVINGWEGKGHIDLACLKS
jgi:hypothetical protein